MNRHEKEGRINQIMGYYIPPSASDSAPSTVEERFDHAKKQVIEALEKNIKNIKDLPIEDVFSKYKRI